MCRFLIDAPGCNFFLLMMGAGLSSSHWWISRLYCLRVLFFCGASSCSSSSLCLLYFPKICSALSNGLRTTGSRCGSASNHLSRLAPWRSHWLGKSSGVGGSGVGVSSLGSLSLGRADICVMGVKEGCRSPNWRV